MNLVASSNNPPLINWSLIDSAFNWFAIDSDGLGCVYTEQPVCNYVTLEWNANFQATTATATAINRLVVGYFAVKVDWKLTVIQRLINLDWLLVDSEYNYFAVDLDGKGHAFVTMPFVENSAYWSTNNLADNYQQLSGCFDATNWESLVVTRPGIVNLPIPIVAEPISVDEPSAIVDEPYAIVDEPAIADTYSKAQLLSFFNWFCSRQDFKTFSNAGPEMLKCMHLFFADELSKLNNAKLLLEANGYLVNKI